MFAKLNYLSLFICTCLFFIQSIQSMDNTKSTSPEVRCKVFESYYLENPDNEDPSVFKHMKIWHDEDFKAFEPTVSESANKERLKRIHSTLDQSFSNGNVSFTKIALTYLLYSYVSALEQHSVRTPEELDTAIDLIKEYFEKAGMDGYISDLTDFQKYDHNKFGRLGKVINCDRYKLHWLPFVSKTGLVTYRTLNNLYGMRAPTLGVPLLKRTSFDGNLDKTQDEDANHEVNHGGCFDSQFPEFCPAIYGNYRIANHHVRNISDLKTQIICDYFLFELGHEHLFALNRDLDSIELKPKWYLTLEEACDHTLRYLLDTLKRSSQSLPVEFFWKLTSTSCFPTDDGLSFAPLSMSHDEYYATTSKLTSFVNPQSKLLLSLEEIINKQGLSKTQPLRQSDIMDPFVPNLGERLKLNTAAYTELRLYEYELGLQTYNILIEYEKYFTKKGIPFTVWNGDKLQVDQMANFFKVACETFKREIGPHFSRLSWEITSTK